MDIITKYITTPTKKRQVPSQEKTSSNLIVVSKDLVRSLKKAKKKATWDKVRILGLGNSLASGWTAIDNNVEPLVNKLRPFIMPFAKEEDLDLELLSYPLASQNNNHNIYDFLRTNPSLSDVRKRFEASFDGWKKEFQNTPFENYVDKDVAMSYYPEGDRRLEDNFSDDILTFIFFNGSSGLILEKLMAMTEESKIEPLKSILTKKGRKELYQEEIYYLKSIRDYLLSLSDNSILTIGNFPYFNTPLGVFVNPIISEFNGEIRKAVEGEKASFYEGMSLSFFEEYGGKIKVDNHPTIDEQYASLLGYAEHINEKVKVLTKADEN